MLRFGNSDVSPTRHPTKHAIGNHAINGTHLIALPWVRGSESSFTAAERWQDLFLLPQRRLAVRHVVRGLLLD